MLKTLSDTSVLNSPANSFIIIVTVRIKGLVQITEIIGVSNFDMASDMFHRGTKRRIICNKILCYMRDSPCSWRIVETAKIF